MAELYGRRISAVLAADTYMERWAFFLSELDGHLHQLADTNLVKLCKWVILEHLSVIVSGQELACIVTGEAIGHLCQVIRTKAEEALQKINKTED